MENLNKSLLIEFSEKFKKPLELIRNLQKIRVLSLEFSLPRIFIVGDEYAGLEALVGVTLPEGLRIPIILEFVYDQTPSMELKYFFKDQFPVDEKVSEANLGSKILEASRLVPPCQESTSSITVIIKQQNVSGLTIVDVPELKTCSSVLQPVSFNSRSNFETKRKHVIFVSECNCKCFKS